MEYFKIEKPRLSPDAVDGIYKRASTDSELQNFVHNANEPEYLPWEKVKHAKPLPTGMTAEDAWLAVHISRVFGLKNTVLKKNETKFFRWMKLSSFERACREFDMFTGGELRATVNDLKRGDQQMLIAKGVMDEAIASAQLEGADTTRKYAQKMLREGIAPRNPSDQMILNNHHAMLAVEETYKNREMSVDLLSEMHSLLTEKTLDDEGRTPQWRPPGEAVEVQDRVLGIIYHTGPHTDFVRTEIESLMRFANEKNDRDFIHPIIRAIMLHFWIGYLHPFTDGSGRLARLVFYWYVLRNGYWAFSYLPLSAAIKSSRKEYTMAYVYAEQDGDDLTYFISYNFKKLLATLNAFKEGLEELHRSNVDMAQAARDKYGLNDRQIYLLKHLRGDSQKYTTIRSHMTIYGVSRATAIKDLVALETSGLLLKKKSGNNSLYFGTAEIRGLFPQ